MSEKQNNGPQSVSPELASRRHLLKLGAMAAPAVITLAPASARAAVSTLHCFVPVEQAVNEQGQPCTGSQSGPGNSGFGQNQGNGNGNGQGNGNGKGQQEEICYGPPPSGGFTAQQLQHGFGIDDINAYKAYYNYLKSLRSPMPGASCMVSINMAGR